MTWALMLAMAAMALAVIVVLLWPLLRTPAATPERVDYDLAVFRDQLAEVDRDVERGVLTAAEADAARLEIKRRMLAAGRRDAAVVRSDTAQSRSLLTAGVAVAVPFLALAIYMLVGSPQLTGPVPREQAADSSQGHDTETAAMVDKLAARMKAQPDDPKGWQLLAASYRQMERYAEAAEAYRNLMRLTPDDADGFSGFGEMATAASGGNVTPEAHDAFIHALQLDHDDPRAQFYLGMEKAQSGDAQNAIAIWRALTAAAPKDAPWLQTVRGQMAEVAQATGTMPMNVAPRHALDVFGPAPAQAAPAPPAQTAAAPPAADTDPTSPDVSALKGRFSAENLQMIQGMVGGLAAKLQANPDDYDGWMLLGRSYTVLNNAGGAKDAYAHAAKLKPTESAPKVQLVQMLLQDGEAKAQAGDIAAARKSYQDAMNYLPADAPMRAEIARRLAALK